MPLYVDKDGNLTDVKRIPLLRDVYEQRSATKKLMDLQRLADELARRGN